MKKYKIISRVYHIHLEEKLNKLSELGYKCVSVTESASGLFTVVCERQDSHL